MSTVAAGQSVGAYLLIVDLPRSLALDIPRFRGAVLAGGRYLYCGSAYGPGGLAARIAWHRRQDKPRRWHIDHLTGAGRIVDILEMPNNTECALMARLLAVPDTRVPLPGFGNSDCRTCPAHLVAVPLDGAALRLAVQC